MKSSESKVGKRHSNLSGFNREIHAFIIYILRKNANELHPLSPNEILQKITEETRRFSFSGEDNSFNMTLKTLRVHLDNMYNFCQDYESTFEQIYLGKIHRYHLRSDFDEFVCNSPRKEIFFNQTISRYIRENEDDRENQEDNRKTFYSFEPIFSSQELLMLQSCVETNPYIDPRDSKNIIDKVRNLSERSIYQNIWRQKENQIKSEAIIASSSPNRDPNSGRLMQSLTELIYHIEMNHQISIVYGMYHYDFTQKTGSEHIKLVPRRVTENGKGKPQILDPVAVLWANGFCYLAAHTPKSRYAEDVIVYRVDRIISISPVYDTNTREIITVPPDVVDYKMRFDSLEYLKEHPVMYSGDIEHITMLVKDSPHFPIVNPLYDTFGRNMEIHNFISEEHAQKYLHCSRKELAERGEIWYTVRLNHSVQGTILWAKQHIDLAVIVSPDDVAKRLADSVREGLSRYL